tara:strand:+ start:364 stop:927 length:564 start_codon:yes stop_codon:yes gene_type:complete
MSSKLGVQNIAHTNGTNAMTIDSSGNVAMASGKTFSATGNVLDVYQHTSITQTAANATANYNSTGLFLTITPKSTSSKFLLTFHGTGHNNTADGFIIANIVLNPTSSTDINTVMTGGTLMTDQAYGMAHFVTPSSSFRAQLSGSILHSPNTTSPVTYNLVFKRGTRGNVYWAVSNGLNTLTAMEIGG